MGKVILLQLEPRESVELTANHLEETIALSREIHKHPELTGNEVRTSYKKEFV